MSDAVARWVQSALVELNESLFDSVPIDRLHPTTPPATRVDVAIASLLEAIADLGVRIRDVTPVLAIPLPPRTGFSRVVPTYKSAMKESAAHIEPPSLYLCRRELKLTWEEVEEFRAPLPQSVVVDTAVHCYYRLYRDQEAREAGWEYYRCVYFEHFFTPEETQPHLQPAAAPTG